MNIIFPGIVLFCTTTLMHLTKLFRLQSSILAPKKEKPFGDNTANNDIKGLETETK